MQTARQMVNAVATRLHRCLSEEVECLLGVAFLIAAVAAFWVVSV